MKKRIFLLAIIVSCFGCKKDNTEISKFKIGTFFGEKIVHYSGTNYDFVDTITIEFDSTTYSYYGSWSLDLGSGIYFIKNDSIEFNDQEYRIALYTWDWILAGMYKYRIIDDLLYLKNKYHNNLISCRLRK